MSFLARARVAMATLISVSVIALLYVEVGIPLINMGTGDGDLTGPFSQTISQVETMVPLVLSIMLLGVVVIWFIASNVQEEQRRVRR